MCSPINVALFGQMIVNIVIYTHYITLLKQDLQLSKTGVKSHFHSASNAGDTLYVPVKARVYYSDSIIRNPTLLLRRPLEPSKCSVGMSDTQRNSPPDQSSMVTTNHVNSVGNKLPKLIKSYLVFY